VRPDGSLKAWLTETADRYAAALPGSPAAIYLQGRGIDLEVAARFRLGFVSDPAPGHEGYKGMISIPFIAKTGVTALKFRRLDDGAPRYLAPTGTRIGMYNVTTLMRYTPHIVLCEGELDTVTISGVCGIPAVGVPGTGNWKPHFPRLFDGIQRVYVLADNDSKEDGSNPGQDFAKRVLECLPQAINVMLPMGMDANRLVVDRGVRAIYELLGLEFPAEVA
jgi:DNA primase